MASRPRALLLPLVAALLLWWRWRRRRLVPKLFHSRDSLLTPILERCAALKRYRPTPYLIGGLLQTVAPDLLVRKPALRLRREVLRLPGRKRPDGLTCAPDQIPSGIVSLDWATDREEELDQKATIVLIVPGLTSSSKDGYVLRAMKALSDAGHRAVCLNPRGRGGNEVISPFLYCAGYTDDLRRVVEHIHSTACRSSGAKLVLLGYSLGSNYTAKYMGEEGSGCLCDAACCIACPVDLIAASHHFHDSVVDRALVKLVQRVRAECEHVLDGHPDIDLDSVRGATTMREFDHRAIAPMFGFTSEGAYYRTASAGLWLPSIRRPTMFIHAYNDPLIPGSILRHYDYETNPHLVDVLVEEGGHSMDFLEGWELRSWAPLVVCEWVREITGRGEIAGARE